MCPARIFSCSLTVNIQNRLEERGQNTGLLWGKLVVRQWVLWRAPQPVRVWKGTGALWEICPTGTVRSWQWEGEAEKMSLLLNPALGRLDVALGSMG